LKPQPLIVIGLVSLGIHLLASPVYKMIDRKVTPTPQGN
jgi:hypothetical protein